MKGGHQLQLRARSFGTKVPQDDAMAFTEAGWAGETPFSIQIAVS